MLFTSDPFREFDRAFSRRVAAMPIDAYRRGDNLLVQVDLPGVDPTSIDVTVDRNVLTIKAERTAAPVEGDRVVASERPKGSFSRRVVLGEALDASGIAAGYEHGVLTVTVPVAEKAKPRRVAITVAQPATVAQPSEDAGTGTVADEALQPAA